MLDDRNWVVTTFVVIEGAADRQLLRSEANWTGFWPVRDGEGDDAALLRDAMTDHDFPPGDGFVWIAAEAGVARELRGHVLDDRRPTRE